MTDEPPPHQRLVTNNIANKKSSQEKSRISRKFILCLRIPASARRTCRSHERRRRRPDIVLQEKDDSSCFLAGDKHPDRRRWAQTSPARERLVVRENSSLLRQPDSRDPSSEEYRPRYSKLVHGVPAGLVRSAATFRRLSIVDRSHRPFANVGSRAATTSRGSHSAADNGSRQ